MSSKTVIFWLSAIVFAVTTVGSANAGLRIKERTQYYSITGKTGKQLFRSIGRRGPRRGHAIATTKTSVKIRNIRTKKRGRSCVVTRADVIVTLTYTLPRWRGSTRASRRVRKRWNAFAARVNRHEKKHGQISKNYAKKLYREIRRMKGRVSRNCRDFGKRAERRIVKLQSQAERQHALFDRREDRSSARVRRLQVALISAR